MEPGQRGCRGRAEAGRLRLVVALRAPAVRYGTDLLEGALPGRVPSLTARAS